jgi:hypothetical protein
MSHRIPTPPTFLALIVTILINFQEIYTIYGRCIMMPAIRLAQALSEERVAFRRLPVFLSDSSLLIGWAA